VTETEVDENSAFDAGNVTQCAESIQNIEKQISPHTELGLCKAKVSPTPELCLACWILGLNAGVKSRVPVNLPTLFRMPPRFLLVGAFCWK